MKLIKISWLICLLLIGLVGCSSSNTPESIAQAFIEATYKGDIEKAKKYCMPESKQLLDMLATQFSKEDESKNIKKNVTSTVNDCTFKIDKDNGTETARVYLTVKAENGFERDERVDMIKYDGEWRVVLKIK